MTKREQLLQTVSDMLKPNSVGIITEETLQALFAMFLDYSVDSSFEIWKEMNPEGTVEEFLYSLKGPKGDKGDIGNSPLYPKGPYNPVTNSPVLTAVPNVAWIDGSYVDITPGGAVQFAGLNFNTGDILDPGDFLVKQGAQFYRRKNNQASLTSYALNGGSTTTMKNIDDIINFESLGFENFQGDTFYNGYINTKTGLVGASSNTYKRTDFIPVVPGEKIYFFGITAGSHANNVPTGVAGYTSNTEASFVSTLDAYGLPIGALWDNNRYSIASGTALTTAQRPNVWSEIIIPTGVNYIRASSLLQNSGASIIYTNPILKRKIIQSKKSIKELVQLLQEDNKKINVSTQFENTSFEDKTILSNTNEFVLTNTGVAGTSGNVHKRTDFIAVTPGETYYFTGTTVGSRSAGSVNTNPTGVVGYVFPAEWSFYAQLDASGLPIGAIWDNDRWKLKTGGSNAGEPRSNTDVEFVIPEGVYYIRASSAYYVSNIQVAIKKKVITSTETLKQKLETLIPLGDKVASFENQILNKTPAYSAIAGLRETSTTPSNKGFKITNNAILKKLRTFTIMFTSEGSFDINKTDYVSAGSFYFNKNSFVISGANISIATGINDSAIRHICIVVRTTKVDFYVNGGIEKSVNRTDAFDFLMNAADTANANTFNMMMYHSGLNMCNFHQCRIYNFDLTDTQIKEHFNAGKPVDYGADEKYRVKQIGQNGVLYDSLTDVYSSVSAIYANTAIESDGLKITNAVPSSGLISKVTIPFSTVTTKGAVRVGMRVQVLSGTPKLLSVDANIQAQEVNKILENDTLILDFYNAYTDKVVLNFDTSLAFEFKITKLYVQQALLQAEYLAKNIFKEQSVWKDSSGNGFHLTMTNNVEIGYTRKDIPIFSSVSSKPTFKKNIAIHRGIVTSGIAPENSIDSFLLSARAGYKYVETDLMPTQDGKFVIMHDNTINRTCRLKSNYGIIPATVDIRTTTFQDLRDNYVLAANNPKYRRQIPSYEEFLTLCRDHDFYPLIELKDGNWSNDNIKNAYNLAKKYLGLGNFTFSSFFGSYLDYIRVLDPACKLLYFASSASVINIDKLVKQGNATLGINYADISDSIIDECKSKGVEVSGWTVLGKDYDKFLKAGVDMFITDQIAPPLDYSRLIYSKFSDGEFSAWNVDGIIDQGVLSLTNTQKVVFNQAIETIRIGAFYLSIEFKGTITILSHHGNTTHTNENMRELLLECLFTGNFAMQITSNSDLTVINDIHIRIAKF